MDQPTIDDAFQAHPLLKLIDGAQRKKLALVSRLVQVQAKKTVLKQGSDAASVYFLLEGSVRIFHRQADKKLLVKLLCAPAMFGEAEAVSGGLCLDGVCAVERSRFLVIPAEAFRFIVERQRAFSAAVVRDLAARLCIAAVSQSSIAFDAIDARLAGLLLDYAECTGTPVGEGRRIHAPISQRSLALDLGVSRKAVGDALHRLRALGLLAKVEARYTINSVSDMGAISQRSVGFHHRVAS